LFHQHKFLQKFYFPTSNSATDNETTEYVRKRMQCFFTVGTEYLTANSKDSVNVKKIACTVFWDIVMLNEPGNRIAEAIVVIRSF